MNKEFCRELLKYAGITINGTHPWDIQVYNDAFYQDVISRGSLALGEGYMNHWWDVESLDQFFHRILSARIDKKIQLNVKIIWAILKNKLFNLQSKKKAFQIGESHYDYGNDLFEAMLDKRLVYTCGYWKNANNLEDAQEAKLALTCKKLHLKPGMRILDIGCGWGSFAKYAAENYDVEVVGITVSKEQIALGNELCKGLNVKLKLQDYRELNETFDRIVSLGMFEHVGYKNYDIYMQTVNRCLKDQGLFLLHTIGNAERTMGADPWIEKYIFPNGKIPTIAEIATAAEKKFIVEDWHNFGPDYDKTLLSWHQNFIAHWDQLKSKYSNTFKRKWEYYLLSCAGAFRARYLQLWQIVMSKGVVSGGVPSYRD